MKKIINLFLLALVAFTFSACSNDAGSSSESDENLVVDTNTLYTVTFHFNFPEQTKTSTTYPYYSYSYTYNTSAGNVEEYDNVLPSNFSGGDFLLKKTYAKNTKIYFIRDYYNPSMSRNPTPSYDYINYNSTEEKTSEISYIFKSWNTKIDGSGTEYKPTVNDNTGYEYIVKNNVDLYAQYEQYSKKTQEYYDNLKNQ